MSYEYSTTGRTVSTSSIYDYPEHLNPFYEDENHKRLRFWQFGNHRSDKPRSERRGSLNSIRDGLRDMWEFKTFRLKKKRSSTLGINKTSESPPPLRRDDADSHYNTISNAPAYRNTINTMGYSPGYSQSTTTTPLFQRNSRYRSTMQDQSKENGIGFHRNDRYRSTIENGFATYSGSMVTSTPVSRYKVTTGTTGRGMTAGVSQTSLKSSNPFDDDEMETSESLTECFNNGTLRQSMTRQRKKRRAPPPPPVRILANPSIESTDTVLTTRLKIDESPPPENPENVNNLTNLTAEIESFVRTTSDDKVDQKTTEQTKQSTNLSSKNDSNNNHVAELVIIERKEENVIATHTDRIEQNLSKVDDSIKSSEPAPTNAINIPEPVEQMSRMEELRIEETVSEPVTPPQPSPRSKSSPPPIPQTPPVIEAEDLEGIALPETPVPARRHNKNRNLVCQTNGIALRITESSDSATASTTEEEENMESKAIKPINYEFQYKVEPIKTEIDEKIGTARLKISESTGDINSYPNAGTERRRSVRDIIESINKSQSLLKVNHESTGTLHSAQSNDSVNRNMKELNEREKEIQRMLHEMEATFSNVQPEPRQVLSVPPPINNKRGSYYDNVPEGDENLDNLDDRNNLLSKSAFRSKKSPTKSLGIEQPEDVHFQDCIDWNPLPKPRRSRHFPDSQVNQSTSAAGSVLTVTEQNNNDNTNQS